MEIQYKNTKNSIKPKNYPKSKTPKVFNKLDIDSLVAFYKAKCTVQWADKCIRKDVCADPIQAPTSTVRTQIESLFIESF